MAMITSGPDVSTLIFAQNSRCHSFVIARSSVATGMMDNKITRLRVSQLVYPANFNSEGEPKEEKRP